MQSKPFALIGVNTNRYDAKKLKEVMDKNELNWRSYLTKAPEAKTAIPEDWNLRGTPTLYLIDAKGTIRYKWLGSPGDAKIDAAIEKLVKEAESAK